jgi:hypothetical protein
MKAPHRSLSAETDPADLFVTLYDEISEHAFRSRDVPRWFQEPDFHEAAEKVSEACLRDGVADPAEIAALRMQGLRGKMAVLAGLDEALQFASPWSTSHEQGQLTGILDRYLDTGRLNRDTPGGLLPRRTYPGRPMSRKEKHHYFRVVRVSPAIWDSGYAHSVATSDQDPWCRPGDPVSVAFVPVLRSYADLDFSYPVDEVTGQRRYSLRPRSAVIDRVERIFKELEESGAVLAVLPEACLSDEIYRAWRKLLDSRPPTRRTTLRWILLGTGPVRGGGNAAVLVDRWTGDELLYQGKLFDFSMTDYQVISWGLPKPELELPDGTVLYEDVPGDVPFRTLDTFLGRIGILICESLSRWPDGRHNEIVEGSPSHLLVPVFSKPILPHGWEVQGYKAVPTWPTSSARG